MKKYIKRRLMELAQCKYEIIDMVEDYDKHRIVSDYGMVISSFKILSNLTVDTKQLQRDVLEIQKKLDLHKCPKCGRAIKSKKELKCHHKLNK